MHRLRQKTIIALYCTLLVICSFNNSFAGDIPVRYLGIEQGLSNNAVMSIGQDHNGFLWIGTYDGLNRYDGYGFKIFHNVIGDSTSLGINNIYSIEEDSSHYIWVGGQKGLSVYNPARSGFFSVKYLSLQGATEYLQDNVHVVRAVNAACILVGTQHNGLLAFESSTKTGVQIPLNNRIGAYDVTAIEYSDKNIWVFVQHEGLYRYDERLKKLILVNNSIQQANCIKTDKKGSLWLANDNGLYRYTPSTNSFSQNCMPSPMKVVTLCADKQNVLWIGSDGAGVWLMPDNTSTATPLLKQNGKSVVNSNSVYIIYEDVEGRKWIGTLRGGINIIEPGAAPFGTVTYNGGGDNNLVDNFILSFCEDEKHNVWIGTDGAGLRYWDRHNNSFTLFKRDVTNASSISSNFITSITRDYNNDLWISTWFGGINRLQKSSGSFVKYTCYNPVTHAAENNVWLVYEDAQKRLWASATNEGCLYLFNRTANQFELFDAGLTNLQCLTEDKNGNFWGGNYTTLIKIDREHKKHVVYNIGYPVRCIHEDSFGNLWIGTQGGGLLLFNRNTGEYVRYTTKDGLPGNTLLRFLEDPHGNLWISTFYGLCKFNLQNKTCRNFTQSDGLQSNQFSFNAALALQSGELLFGGIKGFNIFYPDSIRQNMSPLRIFLNGLKINNKPVEEDVSYAETPGDHSIKQITVPFDKAMLSIDFIALAYTGADKIKYAYYLEGWDKDWNYVNDIRTANYSKLREGNYTFKIKVTNPDGAWSSATNLLQITVLPPWYRTWWAYVLYGLFFAGSVYIYIMYTKRQERLKFEIKLAHLEGEKEKKLSEKKLSFFTNISHEFRSPLTLIIDPLKKAIHSNGIMYASDVAIAHRNARRLLSLVDQLLLFRKADSGADILKISVINMVELCNEVYQCFVQQASSRSIEYHFTTSRDYIEIHGDYEKIEIALFNILSNAFKFTPDHGSIGFTITDNANSVTVQISDTGCGIPEADTNRIFGKFQQADTPGNTKTGFGIGLYLVKHFIESHKGSVGCQSKLGEGTTFSISLLKGTGHLPSTHVLQEPGRKFELLDELVEEQTPVDLMPSSSVALNSKTAEEVITDKRSVLVIDDNEEIRNYLQQLFAEQYLVYSADNGTDGFRLAEKHLPDLVISDINMTGMDGIELCTKIRQTETLAHIPVILLTATTTAATKLKGIEGGADDYITKPFDSTYLLARVETILKNRNMLQRYFLDSITLKETTVKVPAEYQDFLRKCISVIEANIDNEEFTMKKFSQAMGMSHSGLNQKVKAISGQRLNAFIRSIRLRRAAVLMLTENMNITQAAFQVGISDTRYFREQFVKIFGMTPSDYIRKYRNSFNQNLNTIKTQ
jgi:signal transduction histidine kinase/ligand-binding sensor domain-containing protein/DNA-binding response OmpR family regulator